VTAEEEDGAGGEDGDIEHEFAVKLPEERRLAALISLVEAWVARVKEVFQVWDKLMVVIVILYIVMYMYM
jgi:hypothetical protein